MFTNPKTEELMVRMALEKLTARQKEVWELWNYDRLTQEEVGNKLGISQSVVARHIKAIQDKVVKFCKENKAAYILLKLQQKILTED